MVGRTHRQKLVLLTSSEPPASSTINSAQYIQPIKQAVMDARRHMHRAPPIFGSWKTNSCQTSSSMTKARFFVASRNVKSRLQPCHIHIRALLSAGSAPTNPNCCNKNKSLQQKHIIGQTFASQAADPRATDVCAFAGPDAASACGLAVERSDSVDTMLLVEEAVR